MRTTSDRRARETKAKQSNNYSQRYERRTCEEKNILLFKWAQELQEKMDLRLVQPTVLELNHEDYFLGVVEVWSVGWRSWVVCGVGMVCGLPREVQGLYTRMRRALGVL